MYRTIDGSSMQALKPGKAKATSRGYENQETIDRFRANRTPSGRSAHPSDRRGSAPSEQLVVGDRVYVQGCSCKGIIR